MDEEYSMIGRPHFDDNNFEMKPYLLIMFLQQPFIGKLRGNLNRHLGAFLKLSYLMKVNGVPHDMIKPSLFPFLLKDKAKEWYLSLQIGTIQTWKWFKEKFPTKFFPSTLTSKAKSFSLSSGTWKPCTNLGIGLRSC